MSQLPVDLIVEIFSRLPVKTLLRFRCISKQFLSIIDSQYFIKQHFQIQSLRPKLIFQGFKSDLSVLNPDSLDKKVIPFKDWRIDDHIEVIGSCDGLVAIRNFLIDCIGLFNVSTRKHRVLPPFEFPPCMLDCNFDSCNGFGRHPSSSDYKLVRILQHEETTKVYVFSTEANTWRLIDSVPPPCKYRYGVWGFGALVEGNLNWIGNFVVEGENIKFVIVSFDLGSEKFSETLLHLSVYYYSERFGLSLKVLRGRLCVLYGYRNPYFNHIHRIDVMVMKEYGVEDSWVKMHSFPIQGIPMQSVDMQFAYVSLHSNHEVGLITDGTVKNRRFRVPIRNCFMFVESFVWPSLCK